MSPTYHWREGWYFTRQDDGSVQIVHKSDATEAAHTLTEIVIPAAEWASIIASVSAAGETGRQGDIAERFHAGTLV